MTEPLPFSTRPSELKGQVETIVYRSADERFAVLRLKESNKGEVVTAVGPLCTVAEGEALRLYGRWATHAKHGARFLVERFSAIPPATREGLVKYLGSGLIPGIGPSVAARIVNRFGDRTLDVISTQSARLREVKGVGKARAMAIADAVRTRREEAESLAYLHGRGIGPALARAIYSRYKERTLHTLERDPYQVAEEIPGVGFRTADRLGLASGIERDDLRRVSSAVLYALRRAAEEGHTYLTRQELSQRLHTYMVPPATLPAALRHLDGRGEVQLEEGLVFPRALFVAECEVTRRLAQLSTFRPRPDSREAPPPKSQRGEHLNQLSALQHEAASASLATGLLVLTGGPGTGKTTAVSAIVDAHKAENHHIALCAPTGRAAKRLAEATGHPASTVHRLLEWNPATHAFGRNARNPLEADLVLVDEASMLDLPLCQHLLLAISRTTTVVLVGDANQLPPIGPGPVLRALLESNVGKVIRLTQVFRQAEKSAIVRCAHALLGGVLPDNTSTSPSGDGDLFIVRTKDAERSLERLLATLDRITKAYHLDPVQDVQVLSAMRKGPLGVVELNALLQTTLNPQAKPVSPGGLRSGDKVMQLRNDYDRDIYNGDLGSVVERRGEQTIIDFDGRKIIFEPKDLDSVALAYACTIHKAQGSEFPAVVVMLDTGHHILLNRALLYTAITRAKKIAVIIGPPRAIERAVRHAPAGRANTRLHERLITCVQEQRERHHETPAGNL